MAVNITFTGDIYDTNKVKFSGSEISYQVYFRDVDNVGSASTWSNVRTSGFGQYNFNLADSDLLGTSGNVGDNDIVVIVFWISGNDRNANCSTLIEWSAFEIVLGTGPGMNPGGDSYVNDTQIKSNICPNLIWSLVDAGFVDTNYTTTHDSNDDHSWILSGTTNNPLPINMYHWRTRYGQNINIINAVDNTDYDWDDGNQDNNLPGVATATHQWDDAGYYDVEIVIEDKCTCTVTGTETIKVYYHPPVPDIEMIPAVPDPNEPVSFQYNGADIDSTISGINWVINDSGVYGNTNTTTSGARDDTIPHSSGQGTDWCGEAAAFGAFTNPDTHNVALEITWWDGFEFHVMSYNENFNQGKFSGPTVDFSQTPPLATVSSGVKFTNTSTDTSRVGLGLPDCDEYEWTWTEGGIDTVYSDKPFTYELEQIPASDNCQVKLCADYSDGWDTKTVCETKSIVFNPVVTVTPVECYYNLNITGTSSDGTVTGYSWTIASGIDQTGPWVDVWSSPEGIDQNDKKVSFPAIGWYRITGYIYGSGATASDDEIMFIDTVCPPADAIYDIWNGTGELDFGGDWTHSGYGSETTGSKYGGTNGLDASGMKNANKITFSTPSSVVVDIGPYDLLIAYINIREWAAHADMEVELTGVGSAKGTVNLSDYVNFSTMQQWQKIHIPLADFGLSSAYATRLRFTATGDIGLWMDDLEFNMGVLIYTPICGPDMDSHEVGVKATYAQEVKPSMKAIMDIQPSARIIKTFPRPINI